MMLFKFRREIKLLDVPFLLGMHLLVLSAHVNCILLCLCNLDLLRLLFIRSFILEINFYKAVIQIFGYSAVVGLVALLMSFDTYGRSYMNTNHITRGTKSITEAKNRSAVQTNSYEYATNWSFSR